MRIAYADPPYPGQSKKRYADHPDYAGEVDHRALARDLRAYDGWVLHTSSVALFHVQNALCETDEWPMQEDGTWGSGTYRVCAWVKPFAAFKRNVPLAYAWEPVLVKRCRKQVVDGRDVMRDWIAEGITMRRGLAGAKPERVVHWALRCAGAEHSDEIDDIYPGTGAVTAAVETWRSQMVFS